MWCFFPYGPHHIFAWGVRLAEGLCSVQNRPRPETRKRLLGRREKKGLSSEQELSPCLSSAPSSSFLGTFPSCHERSELQKGKHHAAVAFWGQRGSPARVGRLPPDLCCVPQAPRASPAVFYLLALVPHCHGAPQIATGALESLDAWGSATGSETGCHFFLLEALVLVPRARWGHRTPSPFHLCGQKLVQEAGPTSPPPPPNFQKSRRDVLCSGSTGFLPQLC